MVFLLYSKKQKSLRFRRSFIEMANYSELFPRFIEYLPYFLLLFILIGSFKSREAPVFLCLWLKPIKAYPP